MPISRGRKKAQTTAQPLDRDARAASRKLEPNPRWYAPLMIGLMVLGLIWIVVFYLTNLTYPVPSLGNWNLAVGFALIIAGFMMTTNWR